MKRMLFILTIMCLIGIVNAGEPTSYIEGGTCLVGTASSAASISGSCGGMASGLYTSTSSGGSGGQFTITINPTIIETITQIFTTVPTIISTPVPTREPTSYIEGGTCLVGTASSAASCGIILRDVKTKEVISDIKSLDELTVVEMNVEDKTKTVEVHPKSDIVVSSSGESIMQVFNNPQSPKLELYYGYQKSIDHPWQYYYKVESCVDGVCRVVRADFETKRVWIEMISEGALNAIPDMPSYGVLP